MSGITPGALGSREFRTDHGTRYAYVVGAMYKQIASKELVIALGKAGLLGFLGTGGVKLADVEASLRHIQAQLGASDPYGMNLLCNLEQPDLEERTVDLFLETGVRCIEAAAFMEIRPSVVRFRLKGITRGADGVIRPLRRVIAKVSRPEVAAAFMRPAPEPVLRALAESGLLSARECELGRAVPVADDICVEADSGGHTDRGVAFALLPAILALRDEIQSQQGYPRRIRVGAAGGIGTPQAAAAAFVMGADFILTGSINQCTREAGTSEAVKDLLQDLGVQDTTHAPAGDMFELGAKVQVARRGLFFPARANRLYELYQRCGSIDEIDAATRRQIEEKYFRRSFDEVWRETCDYHLRTDPAKVSEIESNPKKKMALVFKWYFVHSTRLALRGTAGEQVNYQIQCGPALGAFNQWIKGTELQDWRNRYVADLGERIMQGTADLLNQRFAALSQADSTFRMQKGEAVAHASWN
jgi:trans-AT polyketide synthase/acyltransferase/oxidoreductase domain-containing protein